MTHSHYALMGGFSVDVRDQRLRYLASNKYKQFTLTKRGLLWVADWGLDLIPNLSEAEIRDKSKASGLAKTLDCVQAVWYCVQCIIRLIQKLGIRLLELNTFSHAICAVVAYALWWDKPFDIEESTLLRGDREIEPVALLLVVG